MLFHLGFALVNDMVATVLATPILRQCTMLYVFKRIFIQEMLSTVKEFASELFLIEDLFQDSVDLLELCRFSAPLTAIFRFFFSFQKTLLTGKNAATKVRALFWIPNNVAAQIADKIRSKFEAGLIR